VSSQYGTRRVQSVRKCAATSSPSPPAPLTHTAVLAASKTSRGSTALGSVRGSAAPLACAFSCRGSRRVRLVRGEGRGVSA